MKHWLVKLTSFFWIYSLLFALIGCYPYKQQSYYENPSNYISATGIVTHISYSEDKNTLFVGFTNLSYEFADTSFKIVGDNLVIAQHNGIDEKLTVGSEVTFTTAPKYFGDGYSMPIVAITVQGETLLEFEQGYLNLMRWLKKQG